MTTSIIIAAGAALLPSAGLLLWIVTLSMGPDHD